MFFYKITGMVCAIRYPRCCLCVILRQINHCCPVAFKRKVIVQTTDSVSCPFKYILAFRTVSHAIRASNPYRLNHVGCPQWHACWIFCTLKNNYI